MREGRLLQQLRSWASRGATREGDCPAAAIVAAYVDGTLEPSQRRDFESHLGSCDACLRDVGFLSRVIATPPDASAPKDLVRRARGLATRGKEPRPIHARPGWRWAALAAGVVLVTSVVVWNVAEEGVSGSATETRLVDPDALGPTILSPLEGATLTPGAVGVRWSAPRPSRFFEIRIVDGDGTVVWQGRTELTEILVPGDSGLVPGEEYFVRVSAHLMGDKTIRSRHVGFRVGTEPPL